jgi:hypothetical protein
LATYATKAAQSRVMMSRSMVTHVPSDVGPARRPGSWGGSRSLDPPARRASRAAWTTHRDR